MGGLLLSIGLALVFLASVVLIRAMNLTSKQVPVDPAVGVALDGQGMAERLAQALRFQTISHQDPAQFDAGEFIALHEYLERSFPRVHAALTKEAVADHSLVYTWQGQEEELKPILLMAHIDVVPAESEAEGGWTYSPFEGHIAEGYIWGRGAMDNKDAVLGILEAVETLLKEGFQPRRTIYLAFGHDEEVGGQGGAAQIAALLQSRGVGLEFVLDEGFVITEGIVPNVARPVALVGIAEKGYVSVELIVESEGGHSAMPPVHTAIGLLSAAIHKLERHQLPARMETPARQLFNYLAPEMSFAMRMVFANLWLVGGLVKRQLAAAPATNALIRTTTATTMFEAGVKENILPGKARAVVNFRVLSGDSVARVIEHVRQTVDDPRVKVKLLGDHKSEPSFVSNIDSPSFKALVRTIRQAFPEVVVAPGLVLGATDSRHYAELSSNIYRFSPIWVRPEDVDRVHGIDERISIKDYEQVVRFYIQLVRNSDSI
jgi:carboxypeptidase PM20D1